MRPQSPLRRPRPHVDRLARLTGSNPVPSHKQAMGYRHEKHKFATAGVTPIPSDLVHPPRVFECPIHLEAVLEQHHPFGHRPDKPTTALAIELRFVCAHVDDALLRPDCPNHIDPVLWRPLLMSFGHFFGLSPRLSPSTLAQIPEEAYRPAPHMAR